MSLQQSLSYVRTGLPGLNQYKARLPGLTRTKQEFMCLARGHNAVTPVRFEPAALLSQVKHSTTEPLCSLMLCNQLVAKDQCFLNLSHPGYR